VATHNIILQGGGAHARVVLDCALAQGHCVVSIYDPKYDGELYGVPVRGEYNPDSDLDAYAIVAIGDNAVRKKVVEKTKHSFVNTIHPSVLLSPFSSLGHGNMVLQGTIVQAQTKIGNHVILNTGSQVDHDCLIGDYVHLAPGVILCGNVIVGEGSFIGAGSTVIPGKKVGAWAVVGAGSVVIQDIPDYAVAVGNPARVIKYINP
jgi:sugar O-acyltransferase (sialic acid O-acetyltransferase NeuD family)